MDANHGSMSHGNKMARARLVSAADTPPSNPPESGFSSNLGLSERSKRTTTPSVHHSSCLYLGSRSSQEKGSMLGWGEQSSPRGWDLEERPLVPRKGEERRKESREDVC